MPEDDPSGKIILERKVTLDEDTTGEEPEGSQDENFCEGPGASEQNTTGIGPGSSSDQRLLDTPTMGPVPEYLVPLYTNSIQHLSRVQADQVATILFQYQDRFSQGDCDLGRFMEIKHRIDTGDARPIRQKMRRTPIGFQEEEDKLLEKMLASGVIE